MEGKEAICENLRALLLGMAGACAVEINAAAFGASIQPRVRPHLLRDEISHFRLEGFRQ